MCKTFYRPIKKTGAAGQSATLLAHQDYNARPEVIAHNQEYRIGAGYAKQIVKDAKR